MSLLWGEGTPTRCLSRSAKSRGSPVGGLQVSRITNSPSSFDPARFDVTLSWQGHTLAVRAIIDSGADGNFIDAQLAHSAGLPLVALQSPLAVSALDGHSLGNLTHRSGPLSMTVSGNHLETISFFILKTPQVPLILGQPWLRLHIPHIDYSEGRILSWSTACHARCLRAAQTPSSLSQPPPTPPDLSSVPEVYHDLGEAFSKKQAGTLPPHRPYDCAIELRPGSKYPVSRLYNLAPPEKAAMDGYITECLAEGLIRPSRSPMAAGFFFLLKRRTHPLDLALITEGSMPSPSATPTPSPS